MTTGISEHARRRQHDGANPERSVWVSASAGTGKTRVLIDRVLRLLLPRSNGQPGSRPDRILCVTYTRAAASEMTDRLFARVSKWVTMKDSELRDALADLTGAEPTPFQVQTARQLFAYLVDGPEQVRIMTIHAFCQSILGRFPLEAGVPPHFSLVEGQAAADLIHTARRAMLARAARSDLVLAQAIDTVLAEVSEDDFMALLDELFSERRQLTAALARHDPTERARLIRVQLGLDPDYTLDQWRTDVHGFVRDRQRDISALMSAMSSPDATNTEQELARHFQNFMDQITADPLVALDGLGPAFLRADGQRQSPRRNQGVRKRRPDIADLYERTGDLFDVLRKAQVSLRLVELNTALLYLAEQIVNGYDAEKRKRGVLDFDDVIRYTLRLLGAEGSASAAPVMDWVMYKLDGGIDHILVDEAQDTNPEQWAIIRTLSAAFFDDQGAGARTGRTLFVVGDRKQSIYSFQGADPESFEASINTIAATSGRAPHQVFDRIPLNTSFRSTAAVLTLVDSVFEDPAQAAHLGADGPVEHGAHRADQPGRVELWPIERTEERDRGEDNFWIPPREPIIQDESVDRLCRRIAATVRGWLDRHEMLPSRNRPIEPRDIMILVVRRRPFLPALIAAFRAVGVASGGMDRLNLMDDLAVKDLMSAARFAVTPHDDLNLACLLKSSLIGRDEAALFDAAFGRAGTLIEALGSNGGNADICLYLDHLRAQIRQSGPYGFLSFILSSPCPADAAGSGMRAFRTRLGDDCAEPIEEMLVAAMRAEESGESVISFIHRMSADNPEIKREGMEAHNAVRLMTVHGSKGLEAPIVILPDTLRSTQNGHPDRVFWPDQTGAPLPLWVPRSGDAPVDIDNVTDRAKTAARAEYSRLLYVALTRAQDRLILAGAIKGTKAPDPESWYFAVQAGFDRLKTHPRYRVEEQDQGTVHIFDSGSAMEKEEKDRPDQASVVVPLPAFIRTPLPIEPEAARPLRAQAASGATLPFSPLVSAGDPGRYRRGLMIHKLLQVLPDMPRGQWEESARGYLGARLTPDDPPGTIDQIWREVLALLTEATFAEVFGPGSRAEVPITGLLPDGRLVAGQIDRLIVTPERILIVDYKSHRPAPDHLGDLPPAYRAQMAAYGDLMRAIYPGRPVHTALIWTMGPCLMTLD